MTFSTMRLSTYNDTSSPFSDGWMAIVGFFPVVMSPIVALTGLCLVSLLVLGGLWLEGRDPGSGFQRDRSREKAAELSSTYDDVTGLPTRRLFGALLEQAVGRAAKTGRSLALLVVELEHFRMVGEGQGQADGKVIVPVQAAQVNRVVE
jgi:predicted signal transduction protein with EAL and GGDEF domain